jgi:dihydrofolate synthase/folylpolyglutamate synthase
MTYSEAIDFLYSLRLFGTKLGLENTRELARLNGNPEKNLRFIHVAGTNGKGSTCAILESIYRSHGLRTGLFTSPHLVSFTERIQVNRISISEDDVSRLTEKMIESLGGLQFESWPFRPTFFEFVTVMALIYFREQNCELVIWETGLGGRLDATNIVDPIASVITNVQLDHQQWLGNGLAQIAAEKSGIVKPSVPVITATAPGAALDVIRATASRQNAPLFILDESSSFDRGILTELPLLGSHQLINAALALTVVSVLNPVIPVPPDVLRRGVRTVRWPGRLQLIQRKDSNILLDGAHNPDGAKTLAAAVSENFRDRSITLILGLFRDKAWQEMCDSLVPLTRRLLLVPVSNERTAEAQVVQQYCQSRRPELEIKQCANLSEAIQCSAHDPFVVITGSLHLVGEAMELLHISPSARSERALNEWNASKAPDPVNSR